MVWSGCTCGRMIVETRLGFGRLCVSEGCLSAVDLEWGRVFAVDASATVHLTVFYFSPLQNVLDSTSLELCCSDAVSDVKAVLAEHLGVSQRRVRLCWGPRRFDQDDLRIFQLRLSRPYRLLCLIEDERASDWASRLLLEFLSSLGDRVPDQVEEIFWRQRLERAETMEEFADLVLELEDSLLATMGDEWSKMRELWLNFIGGSNSLHSLFAWTSLFLRAVPPSLVNDEWIKNSYLSWKKDLTRFALRDEEGKAASLQLCLLFFYESLSKTCFSRHWKNKCSSWLSELILMEQGDVDMLVFLLRSLTKEISKTTFVEQFDFDHWYKKFRKSRSGCDTLALFLRLLKQAVKPECFSPEGKKHSWEIWHFVVDEISRERS